MILFWPGYSIYIGSDNLRKTYTAKQSKSKNHMLNKPDRHNYIPSSTRRRGGLVDDEGEWWVGSRGSGCREINTP
jgi:hypothetical protein